jgi:PIF1-like helicase
LKAKIKKFMTHSQDHLTRENSRCRKSNKCIYGFPHPITSESFVDDAGRVHYRRRSEDDRWIASHIPELIDELDCHIFVDIASTSALFSYLYKYLHKGPDHTFYHIPRDEREHVDEIKDYIDGRYLSSNEAAWRIIGFDITSKEPSVACLPVHLPGENVPRYTGGKTSLSNSTSLLIRYFNRPSLGEFDNLTYAEYFEKYVLYKWSQDDPLASGQVLENVIPNCVRHRVSRRQVGVKVSRLQTVPVTAGEAFYLRCLLTRRPARSFRDIRTIDDVLYSTFHDAAIAIGLFSTDNEGSYAMQDAVLSHYSPSQLRFLFARIILEGYPATPLWEEFMDNLSIDFTLTMDSKERGVDRTLDCISFYLRECGRRLEDFGLEEPCHRPLEVTIESESYADRRLELGQTATAMISLMREEQRKVFDVLLQYVHDHCDDFNRQRHPIFVEGKPGRGKTFVVDALCTFLRSEGHIVLIVGSSALAATLYEGGRTAHNLFQIPVNEVIS